MQARFQIVLALAPLGVAVDLRQLGRDLLDVGAARDRPRPQLLRLLAPGLGPRGQLGRLRLVMRRPLHAELRPVRQREQIVLGRRQLVRLFGARQPLGLDRRLLDRQRRRVEIVALAHLGELGDRRLLVGEMAEIALRRRPEIEIAQLALVALVALGLLRLQPQRAQPPFDLADDVRHPQEVLARRVHPALGRLLLGLVAGDAGRLVDEAAPILRPRRDDEPDSPLLDDGVGLRADPGAEEELDHVTQPRRDAVQ